MKVGQVSSDKKRFFDSLLLADEQENTLDHYLERGEMPALRDGGELRVACVVTNEGEDIYELKNIAIYPGSQRKDHGRHLVGFSSRHYSDRCSVMLAGTGDTLHSLSFYQFCGFVPSHRVKNFFIDHYDHPIYEDGTLLRNMVYLEREKL